MRLIPRSRPARPDGPFVQSAAKRQIGGSSTTAEKARAWRQLPGTDQSRSSVFVPIMAATGCSADHPGGLRARECVRRGRRAPAGDGRRQHGRGARKRAPVRRDAAAAEGNRAARRRARDHQQRPAGLAAELDIQAIYDSVGDKIREVFRQPRSSGSACTTRRREPGRISRTRYEHGERITSRRACRAPTASDRTSPDARDAA